MVRNGAREVDVAATMADAAGQGERAAEDLKSGGTLRIVSPNNMLASDYSPDWVRRNHLVSFPWGTGDRPEHTSEQAYAEMLLRRFPMLQSASAWACCTTCMMSCNATKSTSSPTYNCALLQATVTRWPT